MPVLVQADGSISAVTQVAGPGNGSLAGDVEMNTQQGIAVVDPATATWWPVGGLGRDAAAGAVVNGQVLVWRFSGDYDAGTYHGALVPICPPGRSCPAFYDKPVVTFPGSTMSGLVVSSGDKVAAFSSMDGATIWPVHSWAVSDDGGTTFHVYSPDTVPFDEVASMASTSTGILLVANSSGQVWSSTDWVHFTKLELGASPVPPKAQLADLKPGLHGDVLAQILTKDEQQQPTIVMLDKQTLRGAEWVGPDGWRDVNAG